MAQSFAFFGEVRNCFYILSVFLICSCGGSGGSSSNNATPADNNLAPTISIGENQTTSIDQSPLVLRATISDDGLPTNTISVLWEISSPETTTAVLSNPTDMTTGFSFFEAGEYVISATVSDGSLSASASITVTVTDNNTAPIVNAGEDQFLTLPDNQIQLSGSFEDATNIGQPYTYTWEVIPATTSVVLEDSNALSTIATFSETGVYELVLHVNDGRATGSDSLTVTVDENLVGVFPRPSNTSCIAPNLLPIPPTKVILEPAFPNLLHLGEVRALKQAPGNSAFWYAMLPQGKILQFENNELVTSYTEFLNITANIRFDIGGELGLLGMAFHPDYQNNQQLFLHYTAEEEIKLKGKNSEIRLRSIISRFTNDNGTWTEDIILRINQPDVTNNGGNLEFGPDGYLYISLGDGGGDNDPSGYAQDSTVLLGSLLRIDVNNGTPYSIPVDNPFPGNNLCNDPETVVNNNSCPEIYSYGLRKPNHFSFDLFGIDLWATDAGQQSRAEINRVTGGGNYGWNMMEGSICRPDLGETCDQTGLLPPLYDYEFLNADQNIVGGFLYRGTGVSFLRGHYVFADSTAHAIYSLNEQNGVFQRSEIAQTSKLIYGFAQSHSGELYVLNPTPGPLARGNNVFKLVPDLTGTEPGQVATLLSETGCVDPLSPTSPADAMIAYDVINPLWSDNAEKTRFFAIPDNTTINIDAEGEFVFPTGSVLMKHFILHDTIIETRLLMYHPEGWLGYSYEWDYDINGVPTDAVLLETGKTKTVNDQNWHYPSRLDCLECHTANAGRVLGLETLQLNREFTFPNNGIYTINQLQTYEQMGILSAPLEASHLANRLFALDDVNESFESRSKSYFHSNCSYCHRPGDNSRMDLRFLTPLSEMGVCNVRVQGIDMGLANPLIINPAGTYSDPNSVLPLRMEATLDSGFRMPPLSSELVDLQALDIIKNWINDLTVCP